MKLPFREDYPTAMTNNKAAVLKRLEHLKNRLSKNPKYHADYTKFMNNILQNQDAEAVPREELKNSPCWYLPHHGVYHPKQPNKIRVVFDCSMVHKGSSLNKSDYKSENTMQAADFICDIFYVHDGLFSCETVEEAVKILNDARAICKKGNLGLHKFISNNKVVLSSIPTSELTGKKVQDLSFEKDVDQVLGIQWLTESDQFQLKLTTPQSDTATRRRIL